MYEMLSWEVRVGSKGSRMVSRAERPTGVTAGAGDRRALVSAEEPRGGRTVATGGGAAAAAGTGEAATVAGGRPLPIDSVLQATPTTSTAMRGARVLPRATHTEADIFVRADIYERSESEGRSGGRAGRAGRMSKANRQRHRGGEQ